MHDARLGARDRDLRADDQYHRARRPEAILFIEFAEDEQGENFRRLLRLDELLGDLGLHRTTKAPSGAA